MKKLFVLVLVLAMASSASALSGWFEITDSSAGPVGTYQDHPSYEESTILTIVLKADFAVGTMGLDIGATAGTAEAVATLNTWFNFQQSAGDLTNSGGLLIDNITGTNNMYMIGAADPLPAERLSPGGGHGQ